MRALLLSLVLTGCAIPIPPKPEVVRVPIAAACLPSTLPSRPVITTDAELSAQDDHRFTLTIFLERRKLIDYSSELEAMLQACK